MDEKDIELQVRRLISEEVEQYRTFLQSQFKYLTWGIGVLLAAGALIFTYLFGKSIDESKEQLISTIDAKVVEYRLVQSFKNSLEEHIKIAVTNAVESKDTLQTVDNLVGETTNQYMAKVADSIEMQLTELIKNEVARNQNLNISELVSKLSFPQGAVVSFYSTSCPVGWQVYKELSGRVILGVGHANELTARSLGDMGGAETHTLTISEIPSHAHSAKRVPWGEFNWKGGGSDPFWDRNGGKYKDYATGNAGGGRAHNNMPPFLALLYCRKL